MVNSQQTKSGTQCGAYCRWTGPFSHQHQLGLLHTIASHPVIGQLHQLAYVCHLPANTKSRTKFTLFPENNTTKCMTLSKQLTGWHLTVCNAITCPVNSSYCVIEEDSAQIPSRDIVVCGGMIHSISQGNKASERTSQCRRGRKQPIPRRAGHLRREVTSDTTHYWHETLCRELCSCSEPKCEYFVVPGAQNFHSARGTGLLKCQGHKMIIVPQPQCWVTQVR